MDSLTAEESLWAQDSLAAEDSRAADASHAAGEGVRPPVGLYIHIPFCVSLCPYCDFVVLTGRAAIGPASRIAELVAALHAELDLRADLADEAFGPRAALASVYLGGGTPSLLSAAQVAGLLDHVARRFGIDARAEITLEANPGPTELGDLRGFRAAGVTRLSLGAQSLQASELRQLGRRHRPEDVRTAVGSARAAGFESLSLDLLTDVPDQTLETWESTLDLALALEPDHLSVYLLTLEDPDADGLTTADGDHLPVRPGARRWRLAAVSAQDEDRAAAMDERTDVRLTRAGLARYELSNHARPGHESRHNLAYWRRLAVEAIGPGAHAFDGARTRRWNAARLDRYLAALLPTEARTATLPPAAGRAATLPPGGSESIDARGAHAESAILALRLSSGIGRVALADPDLGPGLSWALDAGLVSADADRLVLTPRGRMLSNEVFSRLLPDAPSRDAPPPDAPMTDGPSPDAPMTARSATVRG
jgi:oxygen-independent coproporphyrinogen III oxidase